MRLLLGVTGGIAAYKAADLVSKAMKRGFEVRVVMTGAATEFVGPITFEALTGHRVLTPTSARPEPEPSSSIEHIAWAKWAQIAAVAPMTASTMARLASGLAEDPLSTVFLALPAGVPAVLCPAMNTEMWNHPSVQRNLRWLEETGRYRIVPPISKRLACGDVGVGALAEVDDVLEILMTEAPWSK
jgi:phosphopantothenoylcysteine decarboxylase/phosphopantothenate--cysteine ligase